MTAVLRGSRAAAHAAAPVLVFLATAGCSDEPEAPASCAPEPACTTVQSDCIALEDNRGKPRLGLRMAQLRFRKPTALAGPGLSDFVANYMRPNSQACRLNGTGTFSWLLEIDLAAGKLRTGGAPPSGPYCFLERSFSVGEATFQTNSIELGLVTQGDRIQTVGGTNELVLAMYADETNGVVLPLRDVSIEARLSPDQNCVGRYNAEGLDPKKGCVPDLSTPQFFPDGTVRTHIELELAEKVPVPPLNQTLCMVLARDVPAYGNGEVPIGCKRDETGKIAFRGDWCSASNSPATDTCADAVAVEADFAASAVPVAGECP